MLIYSFIIYFFIKYLLLKNNKNDNTFTYFIKLCIFNLNKITFISCFILPLIILIKSNLNKLIFTKNNVFIFFVNYNIFQKYTHIWLLNLSYRFYMHHTLIGIVKILLLSYMMTQTLCINLNFYGGELDLQNY